MKDSMKRVLSFVLAFCLVLGLVVLLDATEVRADSMDSTCYTEVYTHSMDVSKVDGYPVPDGWTKRVGYFSKSVIKSADNRTYYELRNSATSGSSADINYALAESQIGTKMSLKYDFMVDNSDENITESWLVQLPTFATSGNTRVVNLMVRDYEMNIGNGASFKTLEAGRWYEIEIVLDVPTGAAAIYVDQVLAYSYTAASNQTITKLAMGLQHGSGFNANYVGFAIDDLAIYHHSACASVTGAFAAESYQVEPGETVATVLTLQPEDAAVEYRSSNPAVATVDANGVVTGVAPGAAVITAKAKGCGIPAFASTTVVTVKSITGIRAEDISLHMGGHLYLNPEIEPSDAVFKGLLYTSNNPAVATVDEWGEVVAVGKGTAQITITSEKYPDVTKTITVTVVDETYQETIYVSVNGGGNGSSPNSPLTLQQAMAKVATMDKTQGSIVVELAAGYYKQTSALNFLAEHGGNNDNFVIYRAANGAKVTIGGAEVLDDEIVSGFTKVEGKNYYVMQLNKDINTRHLIVNGVRAIRARSDKGLTDPQMITQDDGSYLGFSCTDKFLLDIPADDHADLEFSYCVEWANHRGGAQSISLGEDGRVHIIMDQPNFRILADHASISVKKLVNPERPYSMFYENALILLDEPGEWYFDNEELKLYYMPYGWEDVNNITISYPVIDDWTKDDMTKADSGLVNILGSDSGIVQNIKFEGITFADTTYSRTNSNLGFSATQGLHIRDENDTKADVQPEAAITLERTNSIYFTDCTFTRLGITGINMFSGAQNVQINGCVFSDISGNGMYIGETNWREKEVYNPSDPLMVVKNCDVYNSYMHDLGTEYQSASAIAVGFAAYVNLEHNEIFNVAYSPIHIGLGWDKDFDNVLRHTTVANNFIHDFNFGGVWDSGAIYLNGKTSGTVDVNTGIGNNLIYGNFIKNMGVGTAALYADKGANNWIWENNVVDLHETTEWHNAWTPNSPQWVATFSSNSNMLFRNNYTSVAKTLADYPRASGTPTKISGPYNEESLNDNIYGLVFDGNVVCEDLNWPDEARIIMANAGLQESYAALRNGHPERLPGLDEVTLVLGDDFTINLSATDGKDVPVDLSGATIAYFSSNESVATVSENGVVTAVGAGETVIRVYVMMNDTVQTTECPVSVKGRIHTYEYAYNGETHIVTCIECDFRETEEHTYVNGVCVGCGVVYTHSMDEVETTTKYPVPERWAYVGGYFARSNKQTVGGRTYYEFRNGQSTASCYANYTFTDAEKEALGTKVSLKYDFMVDNSNVADGTWIAMLPTFGNGGNDRIVNLRVTNYQMNIGGGTAFKTLNAGQWYEIEIVLDTSTGAVAIYVDNQVVHSNTIESGKTISTLHIGIQGITTGVTVAELVGFAIDDLAVVNQTPAVYTNEMDAHHTSNAGLPVGWAYNGAGGYFASSGIRTGDNGKYYEMRSNSNSTQTAYATYAFVDTEKNALGTKLSLKYDFMVDNSNVAEGNWLVMLPSFGDGGTGRIVNLMVKNYKMNIGNSNDTFKDLEPGCWYEIEIVLDTSTKAVEIYVDNQLVHTYTHTSDKTVSGLCMGVHGISGSAVTVASSVGFAVDNLAVYDHTVATVGDKGYASVQEAVNDAVINGGTVVLQRSTTEIITFAAGEELTIDFNGHIVGKIVANGTLYGIDATTKDYTAEPLKVKVSGTVAPIHQVDTDGKDHTYAGYAAKVDADGYATFNYFELKISSVTLRPGDAGIGYKLQLAGNANVKAMLNAEDAFGVGVYRADNPGGGKKASAGADSFDAGTQTKMVMIKNILSDAAEAVGQNADNLDVQLCVEAYMNIGGETVAVSFAKGTNLREVLVAVNATVGKLNDTQKGELGTMYEKYDLGNAAYKLDISAIAGLASSKED